jgi:hypothetical protein
MKKTELKKTELEQDLETLSHDDRRLLDELTTLHKLPYDDLVWRIKAGLTVRQAIEVVLVQFKYDELERKKKEKELGTPDMRRAQQLANKEGITLEDVTWRMKAGLTPEQAVAKAVENLK